MKDFSGQAAKRVRYHTPEAPYGYATASSICKATMELVQVAPDEFLRLERLGKRRKKPITMPRFSFSAS